MSTERITVALLARELGSKPNEVMQIAEDAGIHRTRVASTFSEAEADAVRRAIEAKRDRRASQGARIQASGSAPSRTLVVATQPCDCCGLDVTGSHRCSICQGHHFISGEDVDRRDDRLADHRRRVTWAYSPSVQEVRAAHDKMIGAMRSRDSWRAALVEVMVHHEPDDEGCRCGAPHYPCPSVEALERVNKGIARQVENYLSMPIDEMREELNKHEEWLSAG